MPLYSAFLGFLFCLSSETGDWTESEQIWNVIRCNCVNGVFENVIPFIQIKLKLNINKNK